MLPVVILALLANQASFYPCYLALDRTNRYLLSAYYGAGGIASNPLNDDKTVHSQPVCWIDTAKRAHCIITDSSNRYAFVPHTVEPNSIYQFFIFCKNRPIPS